jgi:predicted exporter
MPTEATAARRWSLALAWAVLLALAAAFAGLFLQTSGDLRLFMPAPQTPAQRLLMNELGEGPGARLLLLALQGAEPEQLAERSRALREALIERAEFAWVGNGDEGLEAIPEALRAYRFVLSPGPSEGSLDAAALHTALRSRLADLGSPASMLVAPLLPHDPTLETLRVLDAWTPEHSPTLFDGVWFSADGTRALLLAETTAAGFDPQGQAAAVAVLQAAHAEVLAGQGDGATDSLEASGPGAFAVLMAERTRGEATLLGGAASIGLFLLLLLAYRGLQAPLLGALPLASAAVAGLLATALVFGEVHGITLAFGFTLIGVAQDYPVHLFSHRRLGEPAQVSARALWPTLATGVGSTCVAYLTFFASGVPGLQQLAVFTIVGLGTAALTTRYALPRLLGPVRRDVGDGVWPRRLQGALQRVPRMRWLAPLLAAGCALVLLFGPAPWWQDDLARLTPVPPELLARDRALRSELGAPDVRWMLVQDAADAEQALQRSEGLLPALQDLRAAGAIEGFDLAARYLPSAAVQATRRAALPEPAALAQALASAQAGTPFKPGAFDAFLAEVEHARTLPPLRLQDLAGTPLELRAGALLVEREGRALALVSLSGVRDPAALQALADAHPGLSALDLKAAAESLASAWRGQVLWALVGAALLLSLTVWAGLRDLRRAARVLLPMALGTALLLAILHGAGVPLTLFHLVSLVLAAGLGLDYALFFEHASHSAEIQRRTLHALLVCSISTLLVFALLGLSSIPVLRAIGSTVALGVCCHFVLCLLLLARPSTPTADTARA